MNEKRMKDALESIAQQGVPEDVDLWSRISKRVEKRNFMNTVRTRPALALALVVLALAMLSGVAYAIGKVTGYVPGVGLVDQNVPLRVLAEPVVTQKDGITITVSEVVADSNHTFVAYSVDGLIMPAEARLTCGATPTLQLPDGSVLNILEVDDVSPVGGRVGSVIKLEQSVTYSSVPASVDQVTFTFPCILPEGTGPENWQIPLKLAPAPKEFATPAVEIGATFVASNPTTPTLISNPSGLHLDKVIELPNSYILVGNFTDTGDLPGGLVINLDPYEDLPHMEDGTGNPVTFKVREEIQSENPQGGVRYWAFEIAKSVQGPVTITLDQVNVAATDTAQIKFDAGPNPQVGQKWDLNLPIHLRSYDYVIDSVEVIKNGYTIKYHSGHDAPEGMSLDINIVGSSLERSNSKLIDQKTMVEYADSFTQPAPLPTGPLTVEFSLTEFFPLQGPWTLKWTPPATSIP